MKRLIAGILLVAMILTMAMSAFAWHNSWTIDPKDKGNWKKAPTNHTMPDSGSFWKAKYNGGTQDTSKAYVYKKNDGRATKIEAFSVKEGERTHLNYLSGMKKVGKTYWIVAYGPYLGTVDYDYNF